MPFVLYERREQPGGAAAFVQLRELSLAGTSDGLIHPFVARFAPPAKAFPWHATASDLIAEAGASPRDHAIIADLKPLRGNLSLFELTDVWGFSYAEWTPLALRLEVLAADRTVPDPSRTKQRFTDEGCSRQAVHQFLYLQGGLRGGAWTWGPVGSVNGVLLWPDAFEYFLARIGERGRPAADRPAPAEA